VLAAVSFRAFVFESLAVWDEMQLPLAFADDVGVKYHQLEPVWQAEADHTARREIFREMNDFLGLLSSHVQLS